MEKRIIKVNSQIHAILKKYSIITGIPIGEITALFMKYGVNLNDERQCMGIIRRYLK